MRMKKYLTLSVAILLVASVFGTLTGIGFSGEKDDVEVPSLSDKNVSQYFIEVENWYDLNETRRALSADYVLMNDLDENTSGYDELVDTENGWKPIGENYHPHKDVEFTGTFHGNGHEIRDLYINRSNEESIGLFGITDQGAEITDLGVVDADVSGEEEVGALVGWNRDGSISGSYATSNVKGDHAVGGLVGVNFAILNNSFATGNVNGDKSVGGLVGSNEGKISNSYATGDVSGEKNIGGLVGYNRRGTVQMSYATGHVSRPWLNRIDIFGWGDWSIGGLIGFNYRGTVKKSFWNTETSGIDESDGGKGLKTDEMIKKETFTDAGWDFEEDWSINEEETYPYLQWQEEETYPYPGEPAGADFLEWIIPILAVIVIALGLVIYFLRKKGEEQKTPPSEKRERGLRTSIEGKSPEKKTGRTEGDEERRGDKGGQFEEKKEEILEEDY